MIYTVELNFSDPAREEEWNAWYETYLAQLVSVPGLSTAQRFRAVAPGAQPWEYLALYSVTSLDVFERLFEKPKTKGFRLIWSPFGIDSNALSPWKSIKPNFK